MKLANILIGGALALISPTLAVAGTCTSLVQCLNGSNGYAVVALGSGKTININSGPIQGNVLVGNGVVTSSSGGHNGQIQDTIYTDGTATGDLFSHVQNPTAPIVTVLPTAAFSVLTSAASASALAQALPATQTFSRNLTTATTFTGSGGLNVIDVLGNIHNAPLTLVGGASDYFVFNVDGVMQTNQAMKLGAGVDPSHILFNLLGTSGNILQTSGGNVLFGTFLATRGGNFQFSQLNLTGQLINTAGGIQFVGGSKLTYSGQTGALPEPAAWMLMLLGFGAIGITVRSRKADLAQVS